MNRFKTVTTTISISNELYKKLEDKREKISRSRYYCDLILMGLKQSEVKI